MSADAVPAGIDPLICPLCGRPNECGAARGESTCWCWTVTIPQEVLDRVPVEARGVACVCPWCAGVRSEDEPAPTLGG